MHLRRAKEPHRISTYLAMHLLKMAKQCQAMKADFTKAVSYIYFSSHVVSSCDRLRMNLVYLLCLMHLFATSMGAAGQKEIAQNLI
ncbi:hypothetical protein CK203_109137 [Vitis vinifera]|uniref:Uncharacterized protein n=1 Tax=Vitis vinifera TaxID=29760 RepID=A0A438C6S1_VITVI|nr:hypothetical protein CK203_109137 [Vitis vinifera]